jgi:hypothetical protein
VAIPKPKLAEVLDEEDYLDVERTKILLKHRMMMRREKNVLYEIAIEKKQRGELLSGSVDADA